MNAVLEDQGVQVLHRSFEDVCEEVGNDLEKWRVGGHFDESIRFVEAPDCCDALSHRRCKWVAFWSVMIPHLAFLIFIRRLCLDQVQA